MGLAKGRFSKRHTTALQRDPGPGYDLAGMDTVSFLHPYSMAREGGHYTIDSGGD